MSQIEPLTLFSLYELNSQHVTPNERQKASEEYVSLSYEIDNTNPSNITIALRPLTVSSVTDRIVYTYGEPKMFASGEALQGTELYDVIFKHAEFLTNEEYTRKHAVIIFSTQLYDFFTPHQH